MAQAAQDLIVAQDAARELAQANRLAVVDAQRVQKAEADYDKATKNAKK